MDCGKSKRLEGLGGDADGSDVQTPTDILRWPEKVPPIGVEFITAHHPQSRRGLSTRGGGNKTLLPTGPLTRRDGQRPGEMNHPPPSEAGQAGAPRTNSVRLGSMEGLMRGNVTYGRRALMTNIFPYGRPCLDTQGGQGGYMALYRAQHTRGVGGVAGDAYRPRCLLSATRQKDRRMAVFITKKSQWDRAWGP